MRSDQPAPAGEFAAREVLRSAGVTQRLLAVEPAPSGHTVLRLRTERDVYFLKRHSKDLEEFADRAAGAGELVGRETAAYACLSAHGLPAVEIVAADSSCDNPLAWPYLLTLRLAGTSLRDLVASEHPAWPAAVETFGTYLAAAHAIRFPRAGHLTSADGPAPDGSSLREEVCHRPDVVLPDALRDLDRARPHLSRDLASEVERRLGDLPAAITTDYLEPRFVHGNSHINHPHLVVDGERPRFTGQLDMDAASAGAPVEDLHTVAWGMMASAPRLAWWEALFSGYGSVPDLDRFRLALLSACFYCFGNRSEVSLESLYRSLLAAQTWRQLFTAHLHA
jgi:aminoglycoside phosphotransferase